MTTQGQTSQLSDQADAHPTARSSVALGRARVAVVVVTFQRPDYVRSCLTHIARLESQPNEVLVIDASVDRATAVVVHEFSDVRLVAFPRGAGRMTSSRNVGLLHVTSDIVAFVDDDANVRPGWLDGLRGAFADAGVGAVAGRTCNGQPGEESEGVGLIGQLLPSGELTGNFAADPHSITDVDHGIGANMAFRAGVLAQLGGFRDDYPGSGLREDTDMFLRVGALGYRVVFAPEAVVDHVGAPHARGRRFDYRYMFWARRNHALLLARNFGIRSDYFRSWMTGEMLRVVTGKHQSVLRRGVRIGLGISGLFAGLGVSLYKGNWGSIDPVRQSVQASEIRRHLMQE